MQSIQKLSIKLGQLLSEQGDVLTTAESCTGGGVASAVTDIAGSSTWFDRAFVTYSNEAKVEMLGVEAVTLLNHGAVSEPVVQEMATGALRHSNATVSVAISGIAGPGGGTPEKPVGTVCFAWANNGGWSTVTTKHIKGDRAQVREKAVQIALNVLCEHYSS